MNKILGSVVTDIGKKTINQDGFLIDQLCSVYQNNHFEKNFEVTINNQFVACVFDGIGGGSSGEKAVEIAVDVTKNFVNTLNFSENISNYLNQANDKVLDYFEEKNQNGGTTLVSVLLTKQNDKIKITAFNIGDSPAYLLKSNGELIVLTKEHTLATLKREKNFENICDDDENCLINYVGNSTKRGFEQAYFYNKEIYFEPNDVILVCSDGVSKALTNTEIVQILQSKKQNTASELLFAINEKQLENMDNTTAIVLYCNT